MILQNQSTHKSGIYHYNCRYSNKGVAIKEGARAAKMKNKIAMTLNKTIHYFHYCHILDIFFQIVKTFVFPGIYVLNLLRTFQWHQDPSLHFCGTLNSNSWLRPCTCMSMPERPLRYLLKVSLSKQENVSEKKHGQDKYDNQGRGTVLYIHTAEKPIFLKYRMSAK